LVSISQEAARIARGAKSLFFCQSRATAEAVSEQMGRQGTKVFVHHSAVSKEERDLAEKEFHSGDDACIVCTSTLELGVDVGDLDYVLQSEAPDTVGAFMQRMGRTGRRGDKPANTTFYCETDEGVVQAIAIVELAKAGWVENIEVNARCWPVLIHQLLAISLATGGVTIEAAWNHLSRVPDFKGIARNEFDQLVAWMVEDESMLLTSGLLSLGPSAERRFGRRNFMELFAVFSSPKTYAVLTASGQPIGTLTQDYVDRLVSDVIPDNFAVKIRGPNLTFAWIDRAIARLREEPFWNDESTWANVRAALPNYRLSKFQPLMPEWVERETLSHHLLDAEGTKAFVSNNC
ncbi:MAG: helicase-related protein, partial [Pirellula staleyi]